MQFINHWNKNKLFFPCQNYFFFWVTAETSQHIFNISPFLNSLFTEMTLFTLNTTYTGWPKNLKKLTLQIAIRIFIFDRFIYLFFRCFHCQKFLGQKCIWQKVQFFISKWILPRAYTIIWPGREGWLLSGFWSAKKFLISFSVSQKCSWQKVQFFISTQKPPRETKISLIRRPP